jgi:hypothetical protein
MIVSGLVRVVELVEVVVEPLAVGVDAPVVDGPLVDAPTVDDGVVEPEFPPELGLDVLQPNAKVEAIQRRAVQ